TGNSKWCRCSDRSAARMRPTGGPGLTAAPWRPPRASRTDQSSRQCPGCANRPPVRPASAAAPRTVGKRAGRRKGRVVGEVLDEEAVRRWCRLSAEALGRARAEIDALNVFPVSDGDTGTNLHLTALAAADALDALPDGAGAPRIWRALARGALLGARGNSGVILSQVFRGLADCLAPLEAPPDGAAFATALRHASALARAAVERPVEGTILSVLSEAAASTAEAAGDGPAAVARAAAAGARRALERTTGQLDVLARSGVVDAGAAGLCVVLDVLAAVAADEYPERYE